LQFQHRIVGDYLVDPHAMPRNITDNEYRDVLENELPSLLDCVPLAIKDLIWFMHDGAPPHFNFIARDALKNKYRNRRIGRGGPTAWTPLSPDLNPVDFYVWGHLRALVYSPPVKDVESLQQRTVNDCYIIHNTPGILNMLDSQRCDVSRHVLNLTSTFLAPLVNARESWKISQYFQGCNSKRKACGKLMFIWTLFSVLLCRAAVAQAV
jgi:hypothetical protein